MQQSQSWSSKQRYVRQTTKYSLILSPNATESLLMLLHNKLVEKILPARSLRINRREVKQVYNKYKPKKRDLPAPKAFQPQDRFLDFVDLLDPLATPVLVQKGTEK